MDELIDDIFNDDDNPRHWFHDEFCLDFLDFCFGGRRALRGLSWEGRSAAPL